MKGISLAALALITVPTISFADEAPDDSSAMHRIALRGGFVSQKPENGLMGEEEDRRTGNVYGIEYIFLKPFGESNRYKWGVSGGFDKISNTFYFNDTTTSKDLDLFSTRAGGIFGFGITKQIDVYGKLGLSYNHGDVGTEQINGLGVFEAVGFSYQSPNGAFSSIEGQIDTFNDGDYKTPFNLSVIISAGFTF
jgi:hypothetical protein